MQRPVSLIFVTLPNVFVNMAGGRLWGALFFLFMTFASFSTVLAVFENIMSSLHGYASAGAGKRPRWSTASSSSSPACPACWATMSGVGAASLIGGRDVLDSEDFLVSNLLLPIGSLIYLLFCVTKWGWGVGQLLRGSQYRCRH